MSALGTLLLGWFSLVPVFHEDRAPEITEAKAAQQVAIAQAIESAVESVRWGGTRRELAAALFVTGSFETNWSLRIMNGGCRIGTRECDRGRAVSNFQLHSGSTLPLDQYNLAATDVKIAAREAARALVMRRGMCRRYAHGRDELMRMVFASYAGRGCLGAFPGLEARVRLFKKLVSA